MSTIQTDQVSNPLLSSFDFKIRFLSFVDRSLFPFRTLKFLAMVFGLAGAFSSGLPAHAADPPGFATWKDLMIYFGTLQCGYYADLPMQTNADPYYDGGRVMYQIGDYLGSPSNGVDWYTCASNAAHLYQEPADPVRVVISSTMMENWKFTAGLRRHFTSTGYLLSKNNVIMMATTGIGNPDTEGTWTGKCSAREHSYILKNMIDAAALGFPISASHRDYEKDLLLSIMNNQWFANPISTPTKSTDNCSGVPGDEVVVQSFMVGLVAEALIKYHEEVAPIPTLVTTLKNAADKLYAWNWVPGAGGFRYDIPPSTFTAPQSGLNGLIVPMYTWLYKQTGNTLYRDRADEIFTNHVHRGWCGSVPPTYNEIDPDGRSCTDVPASNPQDNAAIYYWFGKQFDQAYIWTFKHVEWRGGGGPIVAPAAPTQLLVQ